MAGPLRPRWVMSIFSRKLALTELPVPVVAITSALEAGLRDRTSVRDRLR